MQSVCVKCIEESKLHVVLYFCSIKVLTYKYFVTVPCIVVYFCLYSGYFRKPEVYMDTIWAYYNNMNNVHTKKELFVFLVELVKKERDLLASHRQKGVLGIERIQADKYNIFFFFFKKIPSTLWTVWIFMAGHYDRWAVLPHASNLLSG